ncbi:hypothetical protein XA68_12278 [Ophiocordyceps unilateralis]|uniref:DAGKc domain-containing protein n=1 Tax=Ophiocordyceps unilateralis TaxID=268505 RepID=A0A2A9PDJ9_OPHUN|nr:hypothetical protein XA68_12278 [Ophiocordyceps unilateralis]
MNSSADGITLLRVRNMRFREDDSLVWTQSDGIEDEVTANEVLFSLDLTASEKGFIVCCLRESVVGDSQSQVLLVLAADRLPPGQHQQPTISQLPRHLDQSQVDIIVSTHSGTRLAPTFWQTVLRPLFHVVCDVLGAHPPTEAILTTDALAVRNFGCRLRSRRGERTVVLLSGDGGVADLLDGYGVEEEEEDEEADERKPSPIIALLPLGTGNALFHSLHRLSSEDGPSSVGPSPLARGLRTLFLGEPAGLPVFRARFSPGSHLVRASDEDEEKERPISTLYGTIVASYGFHATLIHESDTAQYRPHGAQRFSLVARTLLDKPHSYQAEISIDGEPLRQREHGYVLVAMVSNLERTFTISPDSRPLDGKLFLVRFGNLAPERVLQVMQMAYAGGQHVGLAWDGGERVSYREVDEVLVKVGDEDARWRKVRGEAVSDPGGWPGSEAAVILRRLFFYSCRGGP